MSCGAKDKKIEELFRELKQTKEQNQVTETKFNNIYTKFMEEKLLKTQGSFFVRYYKLFYVLRHQNNNTLLSKDATLQGHLSTINELKQQMQFKLENEKNGGKRNLKTKQKREKLQQIFFRIKNFKQNYEHKIQQKISELQGELLRLYQEKKNESQRTAIASTTTNNSFGLRLDDSTCFFISLLVKITKHLKASAGSNKIDQKEKKSDSIETKANVEKTNQKITSKNKKQRSANAQGPLDRKDETSEKAQSKKTKQKNSKDKENSSKPHWPDSNNWNAPKNRTYSIKNKPKKHKIYLPTLRFVCTNDENNEPTNNTIVWFCLKFFYSLFEIFKG
ncbi:hypothetical protein RFI_03568 [Reticulomyxa filosa]|uniref:Uncharacterized protein n=1 Tax=Reticulomyxa filosa TaxID=46433 RepID=X6P7B8_RETFI|nr:hypothetical protein RFI_03568 [Reticulomyxa filosa]|eukprot:ETO33532.1 hypothetical protein RFI_03568 [Reticulomyxa filosa]